MSQLRLFLCLRQAVFLPVLPDKMINWCTLILVLCWLINITDIFFFPGTVVSFSHQYKRGNFLNKLSCCQSTMVAFLAGHVHYWFSCHYLLFSAVGSVRQRMAKHITVYLFCCSIQVHVILPMCIVKQCHCDRFVVRLVRAGPWHRQ